MCNEQKLHNNSIQMSLWGAEQQKLFPEEELFSTPQQISLQTTAGQQCSACTVCPQQTPNVTKVAIEAAVGCPLKLIEQSLLSSADTMNPFHQCNSSLISTVATHLIQLYFTQVLFITGSLDVATVSFKQINLTFS